MKKGFTVLELLIATVIAGIILTGVATTFGSGLRLLRLAMAEAELSIASRQMRDRLLFALECPQPNEQMSGLLSATSDGAVVEGGATPNILMTCPTVASDLVSINTHNMRLMLDAGSLVDERSENREFSRKWLSASPFRLRERGMGEIVSVDSVRPEDVRLLTLDLTVGATILNREIWRKQRIRVPVLGRLQ